jgi:Cof subfamily protein (haloacid dehalogenase superfamily)
MKYIFCDLDGTLIHNFHKIDKSDMEALQLAQEKGIKVSIATGRLDYEVREIMKEYGLNGYRISQNGGVVFSEENRIIHKITLATEDIHLILSTLQGYNLLIFIETENEYIIPKRVPIIEAFEKNQSYLTYVEKPDIFDTLDKHDIVTVSIWAEKDENLEIVKHLNEQLPDHIASYVSSSYTIDITSAKNSKGNAIKHLCDLNGIDLSDIAVIGDSYNDISMFELTQNCYVMSHADEVVKSKARNTTASVKEAVLAILTLLGEDSNEGEGN